MVKRVSDRFYIAVAPRRRGYDIEEAAKGGITLIINNRPDGETPDQMSSEEIEAQARGFGVDYVHIPVTQKDITDAQITAMGEAIKRGSGGYILGTCRTGMRAMVMYALAQAQIGIKSEELMKLAKDVGFDLIEHRDRMVQLNKAYDAAEKAKAEAAKSATDG